MPSYKDSQTVDVPLDQGNMSAEPCSLDDPRVIHDVQNYGAALREGRPADREAVLSRYPNLADELAKCLDALELVQHAAPELHKQPNSAAAADIDAAATTLSGTLGDYRIQQEIGRGGMGVVYLAEQMSLGRQVALKVLPFAAVLDPKHLQRFQNEARAAASLKHPNIVTVHAVGCERGVHYYAMEYVQGQTLTRTINDLCQLSGPLPKVDQAKEARAGRIARDLSSGRLGVPLENVGSDAPTTDWSAVSREDSREDAQPAQDDTQKIRGKTPNPRKTTRSGHRTRWFPPTIPLAVAGSSIRSPGWAFRRPRPSSMLTVWAWSIGISSRPT